VAARRPTASGDRGGAVVQALRPARARLITALGALALLAGVDGYAVGAGGSLAGLAVATSVVSLVVLGVGIVLRWPPTIPWAVLAAGAGYLITREGHAAVDGWAALVGVALLLAAELAAWSIEHDRRIRAEPGLVLRRVGTLAVLGAAALFVNFVLLAAAAVTASAGVLLAAVGVAAAVTAVAVVLRLARA
jgi:hypothetical protein